jgi:multidrug efflux pump subunit AcrA (membrane-fusion protein)
MPKLPFSSRPAASADHSAPANASAALEGKPATDDSTSEGHASNATASGSAAPPARTASFLARKIKARPASAGGAVAGAAQMSAAQPEAPRPRLAPERGASSGKARRGLPLEAMLAGLFAVGVLSGGLAVPGEAPRLLARAPRVAPPVEILPSIPATQLWVVEPRQTVSFVTLRGRLRRGGTVEGEAPLTGQVSRVRVRVGQRVDVNDRVLTIASSNSVVRSSPRASRRQTEAEAQQVRAVRRQQSLDSRIARARDEYHVAQLRLDAANKRLADARAQVARLRRSMNMNTAATSSAPARARRVASTTRRSRQPAALVSARLERAQEARREAAAAAREAQSEARRATRKAREVFLAAASSKESVSAARTRFEEAQQKLKTAEAQFQARKGDAGAIEEARGNVNEAQSALEEAEKGGPATSEVQTAEREAESARDRATREAERLAKAAEEVRTARAAVESGRTGESGTTGAEVSEEGESASARSARMAQLMEAAQVMRKALADADVAVRHARRLQARVESYKGSASAISQDITSSSRDLEEAQEQDLNTTIETNLQSVRAPVSGTVTWVAPIAGEVEVGEPVVRIARGPRGFEAVFEDRSGAWRQLREGMTLPARLLPARTSPGMGADASDLPGGPSAAGEAIVVKVREVEAPVNPGEAAKIRVGMVPALSPDVEVRRGMAVACDITRGGSEMLSIPVRCVVRGANNVPLVGVLREVATHEVTAANAAGSSQDSGAAVSTSSALQAVNSGIFEVEWRAVALSDALAPTAQRVVPAGIAAAPGEKMKKVISGLAPGERILQDAEQWRQKLRLSRSSRIRLSLAQS